MKRIHLHVILCTLLALPAFAQGAGGGRQQDQARQQANSQLVSPEERAAYQDRMQALGTQTERDALRQEHLDLLKTRAKEQGLPEPQTPQGQMGATNAKGSGGRGSGSHGGMNGGGMGRGR